MSVISFKFFYYLFHSPFAVVLARSLIIDSLMTYANAKNVRSERYTVLVVDDSASIRRMIRFALTHRSYRVVEAQDGIDALRYIESNPVDLVITDLKMPNMNGFDLIRLLRCRSELELLPIIMLTGEADETLREKARQIGASAFIVKPFVPEQISGLVQSIFD